MGEQAEHLRTIIGESIASHDRSSSVVRSWTLEGKQITGRLDLEKAVVDVHLRFVDCCFLDAPTFKDAEMPSLTFERCHFHRGARMSGVKVSHRLIVSGCWSGEGVDLAGASAAWLKLDGSIFRGPPAGEPLGKRVSKALNANIMAISRSLSAESTRFAGELGLIGTKIGGELELKDARACNPGGIAVSMRELTVARSGDLRGVRTCGRVWAPGATIGGELDMAGVDIFIPGGKEDEQNHAIDLLGASTGRWLNLGPLALPNTDPVPAHIVGTLRLAAARIGGRLNARRAVFDQPRDAEKEIASVLAPSVHIGRDMVFGPDCVLSGEVHFPGAQIAGDAEFKKARLTGQKALNGAGATIGGTFTWQPTSVAVEAVMNLRDARAARLVDDPECWGIVPTKRRRRPRAENLVLSGFTYQAFGTEEAACHWKVRRAWLRQQQQFDMHPYRVAAEALKREGQSRSARKLLYTGEKDRLSSGGVGVSGWLAGLVLWAVAGFGYRLRNAVFFWIALLIVGSAYFGAHKEDFSAQSTSLSAASGSAAEAAQKPRDKQRVRATERCPDDVRPCFSRMEYALNALVPALPLKQTDKWAAESETTRRVTIGLQILGWASAGAVGAALARLYLKPD